MFGIEHFSLFLIASLMLNLTPGNDMLYVISRTLSHGVKGGILSSIGVCLGCVVHIVFAAAGLSALIMKFSMAYDIIRYAGAAYLIYLGIASFASRKSFSVGQTIKPITNHRSLILQGIITDILNPKVALFFLAFLPQFVNSNSAHSWLQFLGMGLWFNITGTLMLMLMAVLVAKTTSLLKNTAFWNWQKKITGCILIGLGLNMALTGRK